MSDLAASLLFWVAARLVLDSEQVLAEAARCERYNPAWARNRRRKAGRLLDRAKALCGKRCLPWGVVWPEEPRAR